MGQRNDIRRLVSNQQSTLAERVARISAIFSGFEILDLDRQTHKEALISRLNQNEFVGAGIERYESGYVELEYGSTVSPLALIPRRSG